MSTRRGPAPRLRRGQPGRRCLLLLVAAPASAAAATVSDPACFTHELHAMTTGRRERCRCRSNLNFYGTSATRAYVNNNGNATFDAPMPRSRRSRSCEYAPIDCGVLRGCGHRSATSGMTSYGVTTYAGGPASPRRLGSGASATPVAMPTRRTRSSSDPLGQTTNSAGDFDIRLFDYDRIAWKSGDASDGSGRPRRTSAGAALSTGDGNTAHSTRCQARWWWRAPRQPPTGLSHGSNVSPAQPGRYVYHVSGGMLSETNLCNDAYLLSVAGIGRRPQMVSITKRRPGSSRRPTTRSSGSTRTKATTSSGSPSTKCHTRQCRLAPLREPSAPADLRPGHEPGLRRQPAEVRRGSIEDGMTPWTVTSDRSTAPARALGRGTRNRFLVGYSQGGLVTTTDLSAVRRRRTRARSPAWGSSQTLRVVRCQGTHDWGNAPSNAAQDSARHRRCS